MTKLEVIKNVISQSGRHGMLVLSKHSPEIAMGVGILGFVGTTVLACRATMDAHHILGVKSHMKDIYDYTHEIGYILNANNEKIEYTEEDYERDIIKITAATGIDLFRLYLPALLLGAFSIGMLIKSNSILNKRNASLLAAYKAVDGAYKEYRKRVKENLGEEVDDYFARIGERPKKEFKVTMKDPETGEEKDFELTEEEEKGIDVSASPYAKVFDASSPQWRNSNDANLYFLRAQQTAANLDLTTKGHVFLNEVYDMLGIPRTKAGAIVGWIKNGSGDGVVDFGVFSTTSSVNDDFLNGYNRERIFLDFNVDGVIYDLI